MATGILQPRSPPRHRCLDRPRSRLSRTVATRTIGGSVVAAGLPEGALLGAGCARLRPLSRTLRTEVRPIDPHRLEPLIGAERVETLVRTAAEVRTALGDRQIVNINSTATGGGVAEMLATLIGYVRGVGIDAEWLVIAGEPEFFAVTKRIHNGLYGSPGDGGDLGPAERVVYEQTAAANIAPICAEVGPATSSSSTTRSPRVSSTRSSSAALRVVWRCHVGYDGANEWTERAWAFVRPYVEGAHAHVFSRELFAPAWIDRTR